MATNDASDGDVMEIVIHENAIANATTAAARRLSRWVVAGTCEKRLITLFPSSLFYLWYIFLPRSSLRIRYFFFYSILPAAVAVAGAHCCLLAMSSEPKAKKSHRVRARIVFYTFILTDERTKNGAHKNTGRKMKGEAILTFNCRASDSANWSLASFRLRPLLFEFLGSV